MNEPLLAKFLLQFGCDIDEFVKEKFISSDLFPQVIVEKLDDITGNYEDMVREYVEDIYGEVNETADGIIIHPQTEEEIIYDDWSDWWDDLRDEVLDDLVNEFMFMIREEIDNTYEPLHELFADEVDVYLQESLDDEWYNYR